MKKLYLIFILFLCFIIPVTTFAQNETIYKGEIDWLSSYGEAKEIAKDKNKNILIFVFADWCPSCIKMKKEIFTNNKIATIINDTYIPLMIKDTNSDIYNFDIKILPTILVVNSQGKILSKKEKFVSEDEFKHLLNIWTKIPKEDLIINEVDIPYDDDTNINKINIEEHSDYYLIKINEIQTRIEKSNPNTNMFISVKDSPKQALRFVIDLYESKEYKECFKYSYLFYYMGNLSERYLERVLFIAFVSSIHIKNFDEALLFAEEYQEKFPEGENFEIIFYFRILIIHYVIGDKETTLKYIENFKQKFPKSKFLVKLNALYT
jgi:thioredoxin-related protein